MRELANTLERAAILADGSLLRGRDIWLESGGVATTTTTTFTPTTLAELERQAIERTLQAVGGNRKQAAELLGIGERTLYDKLKRYGIV